MHSAVYMLKNQYLNSVLETVKKRDAGEPEFLQAVEEVLESIEPVIEAHPEYEKAGLVEKGASFDARENKIIITDKGKEMVKQSRDMFFDIDKSLFDGISDEDIEKLNEYLDTILKNFENI